MTFTIVVHHKGKFMGNPVNAYDGGDIDHVHNLDIERWSYFELRSIVKDLGYVPGTFEMWWKTNEEQLVDVREIKTDTDAMKLATYAEVNRVVVPIYVVHFENPMPHLPVPENFVVADILVEVVAENDIHVHVDQVVPENHTHVPLVAENAETVVVAENAETVVVAVKEKHVREKQKEVVGKEKNMREKHKGKEVAGTAKGKKNSGAVKNTFFVKRPVERIITESSESSESSEDSSCSGAHFSDSEEERDLGIDDGFDMPEGDEVLNNMYEKNFIQNFELALPDASDHDLEEGYSTEELDSASDTDEDNDPKPKTYVFRNEDMSVAFKFKAGMEFLSAKQFKVG